MTYFVAALAASGVFIVAGWRSKQRPGLTYAHVPAGLPVDPLWGDVRMDLSDSRSQADAGAAIRLVLKRLAPAMAAQSVQAEVAAPFGLMVRMRGAILTDLLEELLATTIHSVPAGRILLTAASHGNRIHVAVTDDMPNADPDVRRARMRGVTERVALRGGTLDVDVRPAEGTTVTLRLAAVTAGENDHESPKPTAKSRQGAQQNVQNT